MAKMTMVQAINLALTQEMEKDDRVMVLGEDVGVDGGVFRVTDGLIDKFGAQRVIDTPLAESSISGIALGAAVNGMRPIAEIQYLDYILYALQVLADDLATLIDVPVLNRSREGATRFLEDPHTLLGLGEVQHPEVGDLRHAVRLAHEDVRGLEVGMDDAGVVGRL